MTELVYLTWALFKALDGEGGGGKEKERGGREERGKQTDKREGRRKEKE